MKKFILKILSLLLFGLFMVKIVGFFGDQYWFFDLFSHWQLQYTVCALVLSLIYGILRRFFGFIISLSLAIWCYWPIYQAPSPEPAVDADIYMLNSFYTNSDISSYRDDIFARQPEIIAIVELSQSFRQAIKELGYREVLFVDDGYHSQGIFVREDLKQLVTLSDVDRRLNPPIGEVIYRGFHIFLIHPFPGLNAGYARDQETLFENVSVRINQIHQEGNNFLLVGDFNSSIFSQKFQKYFSPYSTPLMYTWSPMRYVHLPIDHAISNMGLRLTLGKSATSDHRALIIDIL